jgi:ketosteroid isomerase-like protein
MKHCPQCQSKYEDRYGFCLKDGIALISALTDGAVRSDETLGAIATQPSNHRTILLAGITVGVIAVLALGYWLLRDKTVAQPEVSVPQNTSQGNPQSISSYDTATPTKAVSEMLEDWASASRAHDLDAHISHYADNISPYYAKARAPVSQVRADRARAYNLYTDLDVTLSNVNITLQSDSQANVILDKTWHFTRPNGKTNNGSVHQQLWLTKIAGRWLITGEKDLQLYYKN